MHAVARFLFHTERKLLFSLRSRFWGLLFKKSEWGLCVYGRISVRAPELVAVGHHCRMNDGFMVLGTGTLTVGNHVHLGGRTIIATSGLDYRKPERPHFSEAVVIQDYVWLGAGSSVRPGVTIGEGAIVGMGSVVTHDVEPYTVVAGTPAREIAKIEHRMSCTCVAGGSPAREEA